MPHFKAQKDPRPYTPPKPLYEQVKAYVLKNMESGDWPAYFQLPSEHTLVREMGISRMTIHRALRRHLCRRPEEATKNPRDPGN